MSHPHRKSLDVTDTEQALIDGALETVVEKQSIRPGDEVCHVKGCVFSKGHHIKHSWEYVGFTDK